MLAYFENSYNLNESLFTALKGKSIRVVIQCNISILQGDWRLRYTNSVVSSSMGILQSSVLWVSQIFHSTMPSAFHQNWSHCTCTCTSPCWLLSHGELKPFNHAWKYFTLWPQLPMCEFMLLILKAHETLLRTFLFVNFNSKKPWELWPLRLTVCTVAWNTGSFTLVWQNGKIQCTCTYWRRHLLPGPILVGRLLLGKHWSPPPSPKIEHCLLDKRTCGTMDPDLGWSWILSKHRLKYCQNSGPED